MNTTEYNSHGDNSDKIHSENTETWTKIMHRSSLDGWDGMGGVGVDYKGHF